MPPKTQSPTSINTYLRCPRKYYIRYIKRLKSKPSIHLIRGAIVHQVIAQFSQTHNIDRISASQAQNTLLALFDERWQQQKPDIDRLPLRKKDVDAFYNESRQMLITWLTRHLTGEFTRPQVELRLTSPRHRLMGIIDAIFNANDTVTIVDYKTSAKATITQDIKVQMAIYALLYKENFGAVPHYVAVDFLKAGLTKRFRVTDALVKAAAKLCARIHKATRSTDETHYPCRCGGWCDKDFILENGPY